MGINGGNLPHSIVSLNTEWMCTEQFLKLPSISDKLFGEAKPLSSMGILKIKEDVCRHSKRWKLVRIKGSVSRCWYCSRSHSTGPCRGPVRGSASGQSAASRRWRWPGRWWPPHTCNDDIYKSSLFSLGPFRNVPSLTIRKRKFLRVLLVFFSYSKRKIRHVMTTFDIVFVSHLFLPRKSCLSTVYLVSVWSSANISWAFCCCPLNKFPCG